MSPNLVDNPKLFRHLVEDLPVGIYIVDREMRIRFWNRERNILRGAYRTKLWDMCWKKWYSRATGGGAV